MQFNSYVFEGEPESFDCTECSAVLPSPELLKIHIFTTHRRADREKEATSVADGTNKDEALDLPTYSTGGSALKGIEEVVCVYFHFIECRKYSNREVAINCSITLKNEHG